MYWLDPRYVGTENTQNKFNPIYNTSKIMYIMYQGRIKLWLVSKRSHSLILSEPRVNLAGASNLGEELWLVARV